MLLKKNKINGGTFIGEIINEINNNLKNDLNINVNLAHNNYIIAELYIDDEDVNKDIKIINSHEEHKRKKFLSFKLYDYEKNEKEIKECKIEINYESIPFNYYYNFKNKGKYIIKYSFENLLSNVKYIFDKCEYLTKIDLSNFNTSDVNDMSFMFNECIKLKEIKGLDKLNTSNVTNMQSMFQTCNELECLDLSNFNTSNVNNMSFMFNECKKLKEIHGINKFITNNVTTMSTMFQECSELEYLDLSNFNTSNVTDMSYMFN